MTMTANLYSELLPPLGDVFLEANLAALRLGTASRQLVRDARAEGTVVFLSDATPVLKTGEQHLDVPRDEDDLRKSGADADERNEAIVVYGLGVGNTVRTLRNHTRSPMVVFEPDPGIVRTALEFGPSDLGNTRIVCTLQDLSQQWSSVASKRRAAGIVVTPGYEKRFLAERETLQRTLQKLVQRCGSNEQTYRTRARDWSENLLRNLPVLRERPLAQALNGRFRDVPAFIVGAGPSLEHNGELLAEASRKGLVIAVNSSGRALAARNVDPHILGCMESMNVTHLIRDLPYIHRVAKVFSLTGHQELFSLNQGPLLPFYESAGEISQPLEQLAGFRGLSVSVSVTTAMFSLAEAMGCNPIVLVGQDLAYSRGKAYASGSPYEASRVEIGGDGTRASLKVCDTLAKTHRQKGGKRLGDTTAAVTEVEGWGDGDRVWSTSSFDAVRHWLTTAADILRRSRSDLRLINATEGGSRIEGFEEVRLHELVADLPVRDLTADDVYAEAADGQAPVSRAQVDAWVAMQVDLAERVRRAARRLRRLSTVGLEAVERQDPLLVNRTFSALAKAEKALSQRVARAPLIDAWTFAAVEAAVGKGAEDQNSQETAAAALRSEVHVATVVEEAAVELQRELSNISHRMQEVSG